MKKHPNLCRAFLFFIGVFLAALPTQAKVYDFENAADNTHWHFIDGSGTQKNHWIINKWAGSIGESVGDGNYALYVSYTNSTFSINTYGVNTCCAWAYCDVFLTGKTTISFNWKGGVKGNSYYDDSYVEVYLIPVGSTLQYSTPPKGAISIGECYNGNDWQTKTQDVDLNGKYYLAFLWYNAESKPSKTGKSVAIDNIRINEPNIASSPLRYPSFDVVREDISQSTANVIVKYTRDTTYQRLGYIFEQDTVWNEDATSDSIVFTATNLLPDSAYQLSFIAEDSIRVNRTHYISQTNSEGWSGGVSGYEDYGNGYIWNFRDSIWSSYSMELTESIEYTLYLNTQDYWDGRAGAQHGDNSHGKVYLCKSATPSEDDILLGIWDYEHYTITKKFTPAVSGTYYIAVYGSSVNLETEEYESSYYYIYDLDVYRDTHNELGYYTETDKFTTKPIQATVTPASSTQSTIPVSVHYDCGDVPTIDWRGVMYCQDNLEAVRPDNWSLVGQCDTLFFASTDTPNGVIRNLFSDTYYTLCPFVVIQGKYHFGTNILCKTQTIVPLITLGTPTQTTIPITFSYDWGDATNKGTCGIQYCKGDTIATNAHIIPISSDSTNGNVTIEGLEPNTKYTFRVFGGYNDFERNETAETIFSGNYPRSDSSWIYYEEVDNIGWETEVAYYPITLIKGEEYTYEGSCNVDGYDSYGISDAAPRGTSISGNCKYAYRSNYEFSCSFTPQETGTYYLFVYIKTRPNKHSYVSDVSLQRTVSERKVYSFCSTIKTLPITFANPELEVVGQTYAVINSTYAYGDATLVRNVLEFKQSADASAQVDTTLSITDMQTKITNLLPNTTYYYRQALETEEGGISVAQDERYTFESTEDNVHWHFINGTQTNKWTIGTAAGSYGGGSSALYISGGTNYSYYSYRGSPEPLLPIWAYWDEELSGVVTISFDWKAPGSSYGYMRAYLVPVDAPKPIAGSTTVPEGAIQIGSRFNGQSSWTTFTDTKRTLTQQYHLYFLYDGTSWDQQYFAIDNVNVKYDWQEFTTLPITLTTQEADGISNTLALLHGTVDCDQESYTEIGFEWKRSDAPATVKPQRLLVSDRVDENLFFRLEGLSSDRYYDFRTFCSYQGETYYGEWVGFLTSDKAVLVAPIVQTVGATANEQGAEMEGFIVTGTEPILQKGFEVWIKGGTDVKTTVAEGRIIRALIPEPWSYTTYQYKAYAKTASGTTYGETMEVTTGYIPRDVQDIVVTPSSNSAEVTWTEIEVADYYILTLFADEAMTDTVAVYQVGTDGSISRLRMPSAVKALVTCSIEDLTPATDYYFAVVAYNSADQKVAEESGTFATEPDPTGIRQTTDAPASAVRKILYRGQVLILRNGKVYTLTGQEIR